MNTLDFTSMPLVGNIMKLTGIADGWIVVSILLAILLVIFLVAWISAAGKARSLKKRVAKLEEEITGLNALTTLPPLHEGGWEYVQGADPGSSLVFASTKELKRRRERKAVAEATGTQQDDGLVALPTLNASAAAPAQERSAVASDAPASKHEACPISASAADSVTAQVHEAIFASVTSGHLKSAEKPAAAKKNAAKLSPEDLPPIHVERKAAKAAGGKPVAKPAANSDASLSSRIPRL